jgi:hypothetical protein
MTLESVVVWQDYCGCCGNETRGEFWCAKCTKTVKHLGPSSLHLWDLRSNPR